MYPLHPCRVRHRRGLPELGDAFHEGCVGVVTARICLGCSVTVQG